MSFTCRRCGIGRRDAGGVCDWCAAPSRAGLPIWLLWRRRLAGAPLTAALRRRGAVTTGVTVGVIIHLLAAALGVLLGLPLLWQAGFLWSLQWWWALVPEPWQPWLFAAASGAAYGALAGTVARADIGSRAGSRSVGPAIVTAVAGFFLSFAEVVFGWNPAVGLQYSLIAAAVAGAVGHMTTLLMREPRGRR